MPPIEDGSDGDEKPLDVKASKLSSLSDSDVAEATSGADVVGAIRNEMHEDRGARSDESGLVINKDSEGKERKIDTFISEFTTTLHRWVDNELVPPNVAKSAIKSLEDPNTLEYLKVLVENLIVFEAVNGNVTDAVGLSIGGPPGLAVSRIIRGVASAAHVELRGRKLPSSKRHGLAAMSAVPYGTYGASVLFAKEHKDLIDCVLVYYRHRKLSNLVTRQATEFSEVDNQNLSSYSLDGSDEITPENAAEAERVLLSEWDKSGILSKLWRRATSATPIGWLRRNRRSRRFVESGRDEDDKDEAA